MAKGSSTFATLVKEDELSVTCMNQVVPCAKRGCDDLCVKVLARGGEDD